MSQVRSLCDLHYSSHLPLKPHKSIEYCNPDTVFISERVPHHGTSTIAATALLNTTTRHRTSLSEDMPTIGSLPYAS
jgi:hypothetical protein